MGGHKASLAKCTHHLHHNGRCLSFWERLCCWQFLNMLLLATLELPYLWWDGSPSCLGEGPETPLCRTGDPS